VTRNLITLDTVKDNGCRYSADNGFLNVTKEAMVLIKGLRKGSLYFWHGTTVTGAAAVCKTLTDVCTTKLWNM